MSQKSVIILVLERYFISPCICPPFLQIAMTAFQLFLFTVLISSSMAKSLLLLSSINLQIFLALTTLTLIRLITRINIIKITYICFICWLSNSPLDAISIISFILIGINLVSDWLSKIQYSFSTTNPHSQKSSFFIFFHYLGVILCICLKISELNYQIIFPISSLLIFSGLLIIKYNSIVKNQRFKQLYLRFYLISIFYSIANLLQVWVKMDEIYKHFISIILSQALYQILKYKNKKKFSIQEYISKGLFQEVSFKLLSYLYQKRYDADMEKAILSYINDQGNSLIITQRNQSKNSVFKKDSSIFKQDRKRLSSKIYEILKQQKSIQSKIMRSQIALCQLNDFFDCKILINKYKEKLPFFKFDHKIFFYKMQCLFQQKVFIQTSGKICPNFQDFIQNDKFRSLLLKSALECIILWQYTKVSQMIYSKLNNIVNKVIKSEQKINSSYKKLKVKQIKASLLYAQFLQKVMRDIKKANQLIEEVYFYQENQVDLNFQDKVYISFDLQGQQPLTVSNVGNNVSKLLGFQRRLLIGSKHHIFLPNFYNQTHTNLVTNKLKNEMDSIFLYNKKTVIKKMNNNYQQAIIVLKISFDLQYRLILHGFFKIISNQKYNWNNYVFVKSSNLQILECSDQIRQKIANGKSKKYNAEDFFDSIESNKLNSLQIVTQQAIKYFYEPFKQFHHQQDTIIMFVRIDPFYQILDDQQPYSQPQIMKSKANRLIIPNLLFLKQYDLNHQYKSVLKNKVKVNENLQKNNKKMLIFSIVIISIIILLFVCEGVIYGQSKIQFQSKFQMIGVVKKLVAHYMSLSKLALDLSYMQLEINYNYSWSNYQYQLKQNINTIQSTNEYFKKYSLNQWPYQSLSQTQQYHSCYQFIAQVTACASVIQNIKDIVIKKNMIAAFNQLFTQIFVWSYNQYSEGAMQQFNFNQSSRKNTRIILLLLLFLCCVAVFIVVLLVQTVVRESQFESLQFIGSIPFQNELIQNSKIFIQKISCERLNQMENSLQQKKQNNMIYDNLLKSGDLSSRQNTGRNLMDALSTIRQNDPSQKTQQSFIRKVNIKLKDRNKLIISTFLVLLLAIFLVNLINTIINFYVKVLNDTQSAKNIISLMNKPLYFTRVVNAFMTQDKINVVDHDSTFYKSIKAFQKDSNNIANFKQTEFSQFADFSKLLTQIRYEYMCNYIKCPQKYYDYINILYATTMQKQVNLMISNPFVQFFQTNGMEIILASETLFRQVMNQLLELYFLNYETYINGVTNIQRIVFNVVIGVLILMFFFVAFIGYFFVWRQNTKFRKICDLIKNASYYYKVQDLKQLQVDQKHKKQQKKQANNSQAVQQNQK